MLTLVPSRSPWPGPRPSLGDDPGLLVAVGAGGLIARTEDSGDTWEVVVSGITTQLNSVAFGSDVWVAVGEGGKILLSHDDGKTWVATPSPTTFGINAIEYSDGVFCFYARGNTSANRLFWSINGVTWTSIDCPYATPGTIGWSSGAAKGVFVFTHIGDYRSAMVVRTPQHKDGVLVRLAAAGFGSSYYGVYGGTVNEDGIVGAVGQATKLSTGVYTGSLVMNYFGGGDSRVWNDVFYDKTRGVWAMCGGSNQIAGGSAIALALTKDTFTPVVAGGNAANIVAAVGSQPANCITATEERCFIGGVSGSIGASKNWNEPFVKQVTFSKAILCICPAVSA